MYCSHIIECKLRRESTSCCGLLYKLLLTQRRIRYFPYGRREKREERRGGIEDREGADGDGDDDG